MFMFRIANIALSILAATTVFAAQPSVRTVAAARDFPLVTESAVAPIVYSPDDHKVVSLAACDLAADIERVTGRRPELRTATHGSSVQAAVLVGTLGGSPLIDALVRDGKLGREIEQLRGSWESFVLTVVPNPVPGIEQALVIVGSDRRGTAFGVYELSQTMGVSPWHWWADVTPTRRDVLHVAAGTRRFGPPSVKYRGIFLNDEDWGLQPWAAKTFEPESGDIGPKTYAKIFELMLRLKANTVWPAMHACTKAFNRFPENKQVADDYAIVMGSSHAEPMLRNNVGEWQDEHNRYNYVTNREGVREYWEQRVRENGRFENIYTLGMRGVHDSAIQGVRTDAERIRVLEQVFADQREMLARYARPVPVGRSAATPASADPGRIPQMFCAYKEVLGLYRQGLEVPDDVTIVWPDDNFGYIRNYATPDEQKRAGGFGVYYHLSYLGAPMAYLWLYTTPPALVWEEMTKAYDHGARTIWIANVGDLKPAEIGTEFFLQIAWDIDRWRCDNLPEFLRTWAAREFGATVAPEIAAIMSEYYQLDFQRKPEHLQWWLPKESPRPSPLTPAETEQRLTAFRVLRARADAVAQMLPPEKRDAFFELVGYPVRGTALANERYFCGELSALAPADTEERDTLAARALAADAELKEQTRVFNEQIVGGKWRGFMNLEPADNQWRSFRIANWERPKFGAAMKEGTSQPGSANGVRGTPRPTADEARRESAPGWIALEAEHFSAQHPGASGRWQVIPGLGRTGGSMAIFPTTMPPVDLAASAAASPRLDYAVQFADAGTFSAKFYLLPAQPIRAGRGLRFAIGLDDEPPREVVVNVRDGSAEWAQGVLNATVTGTASVQVATAGAHVFRVYGVDPGVVLDKIVIDLGGVEPGYLGPPAAVDGGR